MDSSLMGTEFQFWKRKHVMAMDDGMVVAQQC